MLHNSQDNDKFSVLCGVIYIISTVICIMVGGIYGFTMECNCPDFFGNLPVTKLDTYRSSSCVTINNTQIISVEKSCKKYNNYEIAIVFFSIGIFSLILAFSIIIINIIRVRCK